MPYRKVPIARGNYYHIYNRGNNRSEIFFENRNYDFLLKKIKTNFKDISDIISYCFMPNHYHLILYILDEEPFSKAMQKTFISYTKAINSYYNRTGHLFEGRFQYKHIPGNNYLLHLSRYIHLNPVRAELVNKPEQWYYSSYLDFIGKRNDSVIKSRIILEQVNNYSNFVSSYQENQNYFIKDLTF